MRKPLVIDYKLPYPTGTATGVMINSFFTNGEPQTFFCRAQIVLLSSEALAGRSRWAGPRSSRPGLVDIHACESQASYWSEHTRCAGRGLCDADTVRVKC